MNTPFYVFMKLLPKNAASRAFGVFTRLRIPVFSKLARNAFAAYYKLNMEESEFPLSHYRNIGELFIRRLKPGARPVADSEIVSPVDGVLSQTATFDERQELIQAKGKTYTLKDLLRDEAMAKRFEGGAFATIYLAPFNYHRIHSPVKGELVDASYCPGTLWPVNAGSVERVEGLFCINERLTSRIRLEDGSEILVVKVGATNVGRIGVVYSDDLLTNAGKIPHSGKRMDWVPSEKVTFEKGGELGRFEMGSTVILVVDKKIRERNPGLFQSRVTQQFEDYVRPQDNGYKCEVRKVRFTDAAGKGVEFSGDVPLFVQALHYGMEDLEFSRHRAGQKRYRAPLVARPEVVLNLDVRQLGLGGASCGPQPMAKYIFPIQKETWSITLKPVTGK